MAATLFWDGRGVEHFIDSYDMDAMAAAKEAGWVDHPPAPKRDEVAAPAPVEAPADDLVEAKSDQKKDRKTR